MNESDGHTFESEFFVEKSENFIIYVVDKNFAVNRGYTYFKSFEGKPNYFKKKSEVAKFVRKIRVWIGKKVPHVATLVEQCFNVKSGKLDISETITALGKLFSVNEHQAAGPEVIDPIIIEEGKIDDRDIAEIVSLHKNSFLRPTIIIILKDNDFDRAINMLSLCPNGTSVKLIRNSGESEIKTVINTGVEDIQGFLEIYSRQCFNACSKTNRGVVFNPEWAENVIVRQWGPSILRFRSMLLYDYKAKVITDLNDLISGMTNQNTTNFYDKQLKLSFQSICKIFRAYCNDYGGEDIRDALKIAHELENEILKAHVFRYARFFPEKSKSEQKSMTDEAQKIFSMNKMEDYAIYCCNNSLTNDFYTNSFSTQTFEDMLERAVNNVPGLVGMPIIRNNVGVSYLYQNKFERAIQHFQKGLSNSTDRVAQQIGLRTNILIARHLDGQDVSENDIRNVVNLIMIHLGTPDAAFLSASYLLSIFAISLKKKDLTHTLLEELPIENLIKNAISPDKFGSQSLAYHLTHLTQKYKEFKLSIELPKICDKPSGIRGNYISYTSTNPAIYNAWL